MGQSLPGSKRPVNVYGIGIQLRLGAIAVMLQGGWGSGYSNAERDSAEVRRFFDRLRKLLTQLPAGFENQPLMWCAAYSNFRDINELHNIERITRRKSEFALLGRAPSICELVSTSLVMTRSVV